MEHSAIGYRSATPVRMPSPWPLLGSAIGWVIVALGGAALIMNALAELAGAFLLAFGVRRAMFSLAGSPVTVHLTWLLLAVGVFFLLVWAIVLELGVQLERRIHR